MSQHDYDLANAAGIVFRADTNAALLAIVSQNSGATEPTTPFSYQWWADTTTGILKQRNAANSGWVSILTLSTGKVLLAVAADTATNATNATNATTATNTASKTGTGSTYVTDTSPTLVTPALGVATATSLVAAGSLVSSSPTAGIGYSAGAGGYVEQLTSNVTNVTLNKICGAVLGYGGSVTAGTTYTFNINNSVVAYGDIVVGGAGRLFSAQAGYIIVKYTATGSGTEPQYLIPFAVIKAPQA